MVSSANEKVLAHTASHVDDEKHAAHDIETASNSVYSVSSTRDWTDAEERRVVLKLDFTVLALLTFGFFCFQIERGNIANAATTSMFKDIGISLDQFNTGQGLLYLGIVLLEIPSQIVLQRVGPRVWISFQILCFGLVATLQMFMHNYSSFLATRILLGVTECGYIPGSLYIISCFYKRRELSSRTAIFFLGNVVVGGVSGLLAYGILHIKTHLKSWQNLFLIEGSLSLFCFFVFLAFLPDSPEHPYPFIKSFGVFNEREREILRARVVIDDVAKAKSRRALTKKEIFETLGNWRNYPHLLFTLAMITPNVAVGQYTPLLIKSFGFDAIKANALSSVGGWITFVLLIIVGFIADRVKTKGFIVIFLSVATLAAWIGLLAKSTSHDKWGKYAALTVVSGLSFTWHPTNNTWLSLNQATPQQRSIAMAMFIMSANTGALIGSQVMRGKDAPLYRTGFRVCVALNVVGCVVAIAQHFQYSWSNCKNEEKGEERRYVE